MRDLDVFKVLFVLNPSDILQRGMNVLFSKCHVEMLLGPDLRHFASIPPLLLGLEDN
jgi:hypothetical protein